MKSTVNVIAIIILAAMLGACANQNGYSNEREYRNPFLKARPSGTAEQSCPEGEQTCMAQQQTAR